MLARHGGEWLGEGLNRKEVTLDGWDRGERFLAVAVRPGQVTDYPVRQRGVSSDGVSGGVTSLSQRGRKGKLSLQPVVSQYR
jgi:hypothetical protein